MSQAPTRDSAYPASLGEEDLPRAEATIRTWWRERDVFGRTERERKGRPAFVFYEGPPTANGRPGVHHVAARLVKDIFCRYKTMTGHYVLRKAGWDTHGLPVEIEVEKQLGLSSKDQVEAYGIEAFNRQCRESVFRYKEDWDDFTNRIGFWLDLEHPYVTYDNDYIESVWWLLRQLWDKGLLYRGHKVVPYCTRCETALSSHEVALGYRDVDDPSVTVRFKAKDHDEHFLVWTTTPWTLPSNVALAVGADIDYVAVEHEGSRLILADARVPACFGDKPPAVVQRYKGRELVGRAYEQLIPVLVPDKPAFRVIAADFVSTEDGTGIVHMAPAYGEDDARAARENGLPTLHPVDKSGRFGPALTPYAGMHVKEADPKIIADLKASGKLFRREQVRHSYPHCWRCHSPLLYYARDSWYIRTTAVKDQLLAADASVGWVPDGAGKERFSDWLQNNVDWALSRDRFWGTPLPVWECGACGARECVGAREQIVQLGGQVPDDLHRPYIDAVVLRCPRCAGAMRRTPEVIDVWFDSGAMPYAQWHYPFENQQRFEEQFPADFISEGIDQTRGWFYSLLAISTMISGRSSYRNVLAVGLLLDKHGQKMSKSKGNTVDPLALLREDGADALRWYLVTTSPAWTATRFDPDGVKEARRRMLATLENVYAFFGLYSNLDGYRARAVTAPGRLTDRLDRWILSRYHAVAAEVGAALSGWDPTRAARALQDFIVDELSNWYVRRSRRRFWKGELNADKAAAFDTLSTVLEGTARLLAPFTPFLAERLYRAMHGAGAAVGVVAGAAPGAATAATTAEASGAPTRTAAVPLAGAPKASAGPGAPAAHAPAASTQTSVAPPESVHLAEFPSSDPALRDLDLERGMAAVLEAVGLGRSLRSQHQLRTRQPLREGLVYGQTAAARRALARPDYRELIADELNLKAVHELADPSKVARVSAKANFRALGARLGRQTPRVAEAVAALDAPRIARLRAEGALEVEVDGAPVRVGLDEVFIQEEGLPGYVSESSRNVLLALNIELDSDLIMEGLARELVNRIQNLRKDGGLAVSDRIVLTVAGDETVLDTLRVHGERIREETLAVTTGPLPRGAEAKAEFEIDGHTVMIALARATPG
jgi:isoleucyl-tRNA synthetase